MKTWIYEDAIRLESLRMIERPDPVPGPHEVVLKMRAASLNYRDLAIARGRYPLGVGAPLVPLSDGAGEVVRIGSEVTRTQVGQLVCPTYVPGWIDGPPTRQNGRRRLGGPSDGVLTEYMLLDEEELVVAPRHLSPEEAATLPIAAVTAWEALFRAGPLAPGDAVAVLGTGGVSLAAIQLARAGGAQVISVTRDDRHVERLRDLGAHAVVPRGESDWPSDVLAVTGGRGADVVIDVVGGPSVARSIAASRVAGRVHLVGFVGATSATIDTFDAIRHAVTVRAESAGSRATFEQMNRAIDLNRVTPVVDRVYPVGEITRAFDRLAERGHFGKVVVTLP